MILAEVIITPGSIRKNSLVKKPAIEVDSLFLSEDEKEENKLQFSKDIELCNMTGPVLIPNKKIYRNAEFFQATLGLNEDGYIYFTRQGVRDATVDLINNGGMKLNIQHDEDVKEGDTDLHEVWFIENEYDKAYTFFGFNYDQCPIGTAMMTLHYNNPQLWQRVKKGDINGYSIEGSPNLVNKTGIQLSSVDNEDVLAQEIVNLITSNVALR